MTKSVLGLKNQMILLREFIEPAVDKYTDPTSNEEKFKLKFSYVELAQQAHAKYPAMGVTPHNIKHIVHETFGVPAKDEKPTKVMELEARLLKCEERISFLESKLAP